LADLFLSKAFLDSQFKCAVARKIDSLSAICIFLHLPGTPFLSSTYFRSDVRKTRECFHLPRTPARYLYWSNYENIQFGSTHRTRQICKSKIRLRYIFIDTKLWLNDYYQINSSILRSGYSYVSNLYFLFFLFREIVLFSFYNDKNL